MSVTAFPRSFSSLRGKCFRASSSRKLGREHLFFRFRYSFRAVTRLATLATQANLFPHAVSLA